MKFILSLLVCLAFGSVVVEGTFCCKDRKTSLSDDQVCNGRSDCPQTETERGGEDEENCEGSGILTEDDLDWCKSGAKSKFSFDLGPLLAVFALSVLRLL